MPGDISERPSLLVVSDTAMWRTNGPVAAFEPVVKEIEEIAHLFAKIYWIGFEYNNGQISQNARAFKELDIEFILLKRVGGPGIVNKWKILLSLPRFLLIIIRAIARADVIHTRGPSVPALIAIIISMFDQRKIYWHKYAGNWIEKKPALSYRFQRWLLRRNKKAKITINGKWDDLPDQFLNFANPCFTELEYMISASSIDHKNFSEGFILCFVGHLAEFKGCGRIIEALELISQPELIDKFIIVGDGPQKAELQMKARDAKIKIEFTGYLNKQGVKEIFKIAHLNILPSETEGFPKVIAEGGSYGCIPIVTKISSIDQILSEAHNGFLLKRNSPKEIAEKIEQFMATPTEKKILLSKNVITAVRDFSYERYASRVEQEILN